MQTVNRLVQRKGTDGSPSGSPGLAATTAAGKRSLVESTLTPAAAGPAAEVGRANPTSAPEVDAAGGAPAVDGPSTTGGPLSRERARQILQAAFGSYRTISEGRVEVLDQAAFQAAYDRVYGTTQWSWARWVVPTHGNLNGFAHNGVNYINQAMANTGTVPHEMLHNNAAADWRPFVGSQFDEGATDVLKQHALQRAGITSPNSYPEQIRCVEAFLSSGVAREQLFTAYLSGGAATIVGAHVDSTCAGTWTEVKMAMEARDWARARVKLGTRPASGAPASGGAR